MHYPRRAIYGLDGPICMFCGQGTVRHYGSDVFSGDAEHDMAQMEAERKAFSVTCPKCSVAGCLGCFESRNQSNLTCRRCGATFELFPKKPSRSLAEEHVSPDGRLRLRVVTAENGEMSLGFVGFPWQMRANVLAGSKGLSDEEVVRRFLVDLIKGVYVVVLWSAGGDVHDIWVTDDPKRDAEYGNSGESVELRHWDGTPWRNNASQADQSIVPTE